MQININPNEISRVDDSIKLENHIPNDLSLHTPSPCFQVACTWDDVKLLRMDMERNASSAIHFRTKLLSAACQMQSALSITDLGQLYYKPLRDVHGTVVLSCVNCIKVKAAMSLLSSSRVINLLFFAPATESEKRVGAKLPLDTAEQNPQEVGPLDGGQQHQRAANELHSGPNQLPSGVQHPVGPGPLRGLSEDAELGGRDPGGGSGEGPERPAALQDPRQSARVSVSTGL